MRYSIVTFGCRVNQSDSFAIEEELRAAGAQSSIAESADLVVVNTCSVTASADQGARQTIRRIVRQNPSAKIVVTGCYATRCADEVGALPNVLTIVRNDDKRRVLDSVWESTGERFGSGDGPCGAELQPGMAGRTAFTLRVQTGCDQTCSYCIIPTTRGRGRSVPMDAVLHELRRVAAAGYKEIAITGVHLGSYGRDLHEPVSLFDLLCVIVREDLDVTFRISSLEPMDCSEEIAGLVAESGGRLAPHFHLPLQHASDRMLVAMRRPYTLSYYRDLVNGIVERMPQASIGTDMIVGFPGETDEDFACSVEYLEGAPLSHLHVFPYSDRPGTVASALTNKVEGALIRARGAHLRAIGVRLSERFRHAQLGTIRPALTLEDGTVAVTDNYLKVRIPSGLRRNERISVKLTELTGTTLCGDVYSRDHQPSVLGSG